MSVAEPATPVPSLAEPDLAAVWVALGRVRRRLRAQAALRLGVYGLGGGAAAGALLAAAARLGWLGAAAAGGTRPLAVALGAAGLGLVAGAIVGATREIADLDVAARIDRTHDLRDRLSSAVQFGSRAQPASLAGSQALRFLAMSDAAQAAGRVSPRQAAPWQRPSGLSWLVLLLFADVLVALLRLPRPQPKALPVPVAKAAKDAAPRLVVEPELLSPEKDELSRLAAEAAQSGDRELQEILREMQKLLEQVERGELTRQEAFEKLAELEQRLMQGHAGVLEEMKERLRKAGAELGESRLAKEAGAALLKEDLDKAQKELQKLAQQALERANQAQTAQDLKDRKELAQALERAAAAMNKLDDKKKDDKGLKREDKDDPANKKDEWKESSRSEELTRKQQELEEEERRLKKQKEENPGDEEVERRLNRVKDELQRLQREKKERDQARDELQRLQRDMQRAAEEMRSQLDRMTPEQRQALQKLAEDLDRMQDEIRKLQRQGQNGQNGQQGQNGQNGQNGQQGQNGQGQQRKQVMVSLGSIKQVLRRVARSEGGQGQGQQGQGQQGQGQGQQGKGQGQQGQGQGQGKGGNMKDFLNRAKGQGPDGDVLVEGEGGKGDQQMMILGQGGDTDVIIPGLGGQGQGQSGGGPGGDRPGASGAGNQHDPKLLGDVTQIDSKRRLTRVTGKEGKGPTRSETILGAAEKGFATAPYRRVYSDYTAVSEQVMSKERVPPGYRFYVKRYFQMIKPRE